MAADGELGMEDSELGVDCSTLRQLYFLFWCWSFAQSIVFSIS
jgi:hypothetical protein